MSAHRLTLYGDDDLTVLAQCSTDPAHTHPFLMEVDGGAASEVDLAAGTSVIGQVNVRVLDKRTDPANQATGWLTALLASANGESALIGRRAVLEEEYEGAWGVVMDGTIGSVSMDGEIVVYSLELRDIRERERKVRVFTRGGTSSVFPRGVVDGFGKVPGGDWLIPPVKPWTGTCKLVSGLGHVIQLDPDWTIPAALVLTDRMKKATEAEWSEPLGTLIAPNVEVWWRPIGASAWTTKHRNLRVVEYSEGVYDPIFGTRRATKKIDGQSVAVNMVSSIRLIRTDASETLPAVDERVEVLVVYVGPPSEDYPLHLETTAGTLLRDLYDGLYSAQDPRVRYDSAAVLALDTPVLARITDPWDDLRKGVEAELFRPLGAAPALNAAGVVAPIRYALPDESVTLVELNDGNTAEDAGWEHSGSDAINRVVFRCPRYFRVLEEDDPLSERSAGDGLASRPIIVEMPKDGTLSQTLLGEQELEIESELFGAIGGTEGEPVSGDSLDEAGHQLALERGYQALDRFLFGAQYIRARCLRSATGALKVGDWVLVALSWLPEYGTGRRSSNRLAQVVSIQDQSPAWRELRLLDAGAANQPVGQPTLGTLSVDTGGVVSVPVTALPAGGEARVDYAVSATLPATTSGLWTFLGRTDVLATLKSPPMPSGVTVWIRARGEAVGRRPSAWTNAVNIVTGQIPRVRKVRVLPLSTTTARVTWEPNGFAAGVRIYQATYGNEETPVFTAVGDFDAALGEATITRPAGSAAWLAVEVEPWTGFDGSAVTGSAGTRVRAIAENWTSASNRALNNWRIIRETETTRTYGWEPGADVSEVHIHDRQLQQPPSVDPWPNPDTDIADTKLVVGVHPMEYTVTKPQAGFRRYVQAEPRMADLSEGPLRRAEVDPVPSQLAAKIKAAVSGATATVTVEVEGSASAFPATLSVYADDPDAAPLYQGTVTAEGVVAPAALQNLPLPLREVRRFYARLVDVSGLVFWDTAAADRDALPSATVTPDSYEPTPLLRVDYDDDTDAVRVTVPGGKVKTYSGLSGAGALQYTVGDALDDTTAEQPLGVDEVRRPYKVEAEGGGVWLTFWEGPLHGTPSNPPTVQPRLVLNAARDAGDLYATPATSVAEKVTVEARTGEGAGAPLYYLCAGAADSTPLYVTSGTEIGPSHFFTDGVGSPVALFSGIPLERDKIQRWYLRAVGQESQVDGQWAPVPLSSKEQAWLESTAATWDEKNGAIAYETVGGAFCQSVFVEVDDNDAFSSPTTQAVALTDGAKHAGSFGIAAAQRGKRWYLGVTPYNGPLVSGSPTGVPGVRQVVPVAVPVAVKVWVEGVTNDTLTIGVDDPTGLVDPTTPAQFEVTQGSTKTTEGPTTKPASGTSGTYVKTVTLIEKHVTLVQAVVNLLDGSKIRLGGETFDVGTIADVDIDSVGTAAGTATVAISGDTDTATAEYSKDGGTTWTAITLTNRRGTFQVAQTTSQQSVLVRGKNAAGAAGPAVEALIPADESGGGGTSANPALTAIILTVDLASGKNRIWVEWWINAEVTTSHELKVRIFRGGALAHTQYIDPVNYVGFHWGDTTTDLITQDYYAEALLYRESDKAALGRYETLPATRQDGPA